MSLGRRTATSIGWQSGSSIAGAAVMFLRSIVLARLLPVEVFGVYAGARVIASLTAELSNFGMGPAFIHRSRETHDEQHAAAVHLTLNVILTTMWMIAMTAVALIWLDGPDRLTLIVVSLANGVGMSTQTPSLMLTRRVVHRRLALASLVADVSTSVVAISLAIMGYELWSLLSTNVTAALVAIVFLYVWKPVWRPKFAWSTETVRYYLSFGYRSFLATALQQLLDKLDDLWTRVFLGEYSMGLYSRAYTFATYPRKVMAGPVTSVASGTFAELKHDRLELSRAFFRINALMVRSGFFLAGLLALIAPEFALLVIGPKWLPFLDAFRLMLVFALFDPLKSTIAAVFNAVGRPEKIVRARVIQLIVMVVGVVTLGTRYDIAGVALAVDLMVVVGIAILLWEARVYVDISLTRLFLLPGVLLIVAGSAARGSLLIPGVLGSPWRTAGVKIVVFALLYLAPLIIVERKELRRIWRQTRGL